MQSWGSLIDAVFLGIIEGITEFLPISSTGHLIVAGELMGLPGRETGTFEIFIQLGAILAVMWDRRTALDFRRAPFWRMAVLLAVGFIPTAIAGFLLHDFIKEKLFRTTLVACALIAGGVVMWLIERNPPQPRVGELERVGLRDAFLIGCFQCLGMWPGVSRAAATILGGMAIGLNRSVATEFSFLLAIPTIGAAVALDTWKSRDSLSSADIPFFATGFLVSFVVALLVVRWLVGYIRRHDFKLFAYYRIVLGTFILALVAAKGLGLWAHSGG